MTMLASTVAFLTETTCGESCWHAKEEICRCSCGGKNHGILKTASGEQPTRQCKIDGRRYELLSVGTRIEICVQETELYAAIGKSASWHKSYLGEYIVKYATIQQCEKWVELSEFKGLEYRDWFTKAPVLLWKRL